MNLLFWLALVALIFYLVVAVDLLKGNRRITSYNVCYTKLLRLHEGLGAAVDIASRIGPVAGGRTSYNFV